VFWHNDSLFFTASGNSYFWRTAWDANRATGLHPPNHIEQ